MSIITEIAAAVACMTIAGGIMALVIDWRGLCAELDREQRNGYQLPPEAKPARQCPQWIAAERNGGIK